MSAPVSIAGIFTKSTTANSGTPSNNDYVLTITLTDTTPRTLFGYYLYYGLDTDGVEATSVFISSDYITDTTTDASNNTTTTVLFDLSLTDINPDDIYEFNVAKGTTTGISEESAEVKWGLPYPAATLIVTPGIDTVDLSWATPTASTTTLNAPGDTVFVYQLNVNKLNSAGAIISTQTIDPGNDSNSYKLNYGTDANDITRVNEYSISINSTPSTTALVPLISSDATSGDDSSATVTSDLVYVLCIAEMSAIDYTDPSFSLTYDGAIGTNKDMSECEIKYYIDGAEVDASFVLTGAVSGTEVINVVNAPSLGSTYRFRIRGLATNGAVSAWSVEYTVIPLALPPTVTNVAGGSSLANSEADNRFSLSWDAITGESYGPIIGYNVFYKDTLFNINTVFALTNSAIIDIPLSTSGYHTPYIFYVTGVNQLGQSVNAETVTVYTVKEAPVITVEPTGASTMDITLSTYYSTLADYGVYRRVGGTQYVDGDYGSFSLIGGATPFASGAGGVFTDTTVTLGYYYEYYVSLTNDTVSSNGGQSADSNIIGNISASSPGAPTLSFDSNTDSTLNISYTGTYNGAEVTSITTEVATDVGFNTIVSPTVVTNDLTNIAGTYSGDITISDLSANTIYWVRCSAVVTDSNFNFSLTGSASTAINPVTDPSSSIGLAVSGYGTFGAQTVVLDITDTSNNQINTNDNYVIYRYPEIATFDGLGSSETLSGIFDDTSFNTTEDASFTFNVGVTSYTDTTPVIGRLYKYEIIRTNQNAGNTITGTSAANVTTYGTTFTTAYTHYAPAQLATNEMSIVTLPLLTDPSLNDYVDAEFTTFGTQVRISWSAYNTNSAITTYGSKVTGYKVIYEKATQVQIEVEVDDTVNFLDVSGLTNGIQYVVAILPQNNATESNATIDPDDTVNDNAIIWSNAIAPVFDAFVANSTTSMDISFNTFNLNGGAFSTLYITATDISSNATVDASFTSIATTYTVPGLTEGETYSFAAYIETDAPTGNDAETRISDTTTSVSSSLVYTEPDIIGDLQTYPIKTTSGSDIVGSLTSLGLIWTVPENNGSELTEYTVRVIPSIDAAYDVSFNVDEPVLVAGTKKQFTITGLNVNNTYTFTIAAQNIDYSTPSSATNGYLYDITDTNLIVPYYEADGSTQIAASPMTNPNGFTAFGVSYTQKSTTETTATFTWTDDNYNGNGNMVNHRVAWTNDNNDSGTANFAPTDLKTLDISSNYTYEYTLTRSNAVFENIDADDITVSSSYVPSQPDVSGGSGTASVNYAASVIDIALNGIVANTGSGATSTGVTYVITATPTSTGSGEQTVPKSSNGYVTYNATSIDDTITANATAFNTATLRYGTEYTFSVVFTNNSGFTSDSVVIDTLTPSTVPSPVALSNVTHGDGSLTINWSYPTNLIGSPLTTVDLIVNSGDNTSTIAAGAVTTQNVSYTAGTNAITGLVNGTAYTLVLKLNAANGQSSVLATYNPYIATLSDGRYASISNATVPSTGPIAVTSFIPKPVSDAIDVYMDYSTTQLSTNGGLPYIYIVQLLGGSGFTTRTETATASPHRFTGLTTTNETYTVKIWKSNVIDAYNQLTTSNITLTDVSSPVTNLAIAKGTSSGSSAFFTVSFNMPADNNGGTINTISLQYIIANGSGGVHSQIANIKLSVPPGVTTGSAVSRSFLVNSLYTLANHTFPTSTLTSAIFMSATALNEAGASLIGSTSRYAMNYNISGGFATADTGTQITLP